MKLSFLLFTMLTLGLLQSHAYANCEYKGEHYNVFEKIALIDPAFENFDNALGMTPKEAGYSGDGYAVLLSCAPVVNMTLMESGQFSTGRVPALKFEWVVSDVYSSFSKIAIDTIPNGEKL